MAVDFELGTDLNKIEFDVKGIGGAPGKSAYDLAVLNGYTGSIERWLAEVHPETRVTSLDDTLIADANVIKVIGIPVFVGDADFDKYTAYGITETGWYAFVRITPKPGVTAADATIEGTAGFILADDHVDVAVRYEVASMAKAIKITWGGETETFVFEAEDLAIRNLDDRVTFYVYDVAKYTKWEYTRSEDAVFIGTEYYTEENGIYTRAAVKAFEAIPADTYYTHSYIRSEDEVFLEGITYYTLAAGVYTPAEVVPGEPLAPAEGEPEVVYYVDNWTLTTDTEFVGNRYFEKIGDNYEQIAVKAGEPCSFYTKHVEYPLTTDTAFVGTQYWAKDDESDLGYARAAVLAGEEIPAGEYFTHSYTKLTAAGKFAEGVRYYKLVGTEYELQEVTVGASYAKNVYYIDHWAEATGTFAGTAYWTETDGEWSQAAVIAGESIPEEEYHLRVITWPQATGEMFETGVVYYTHINGAYEEVPDMAESTIPAYYVHSKVIFSGMVRNVTYCCNTTIDCPMEFILPVVEDEEHGCWFEIRCLHAGEYSMTLTPPSSDIKIATEHTQKEKEGINMINLHYTAINGVKVWRFLNTHSTIPA